MRAWWWLRQQYVGGDRSQWGCGSEQFLDMRKQRVKGVKRANPEAVHRLAGKKKPRLEIQILCCLFLMLTYSPSNPDCHVLELGTGQLGKKMWKTRMLKCEGIFFHQPPLIGANHGMKIRCSGTRQSCPFGPQQTWKREANTFALSNIRIFATGKWGKKIIKIQCGNYIPFANGWGSAFENKLFGESSAYPK